MVSIDWGTRVITIAQADLTFVSGSLYSLDTDAFRLILKDEEDGEVGISFPDTHVHNTAVTVAGTTFARTLEIINGYTVVFEDGQYAVRLEGSNNNLFEDGVLVRNQVSVISTNSAGLIAVGSEEHSSHMAVAWDPTAGTLLFNVWKTRDGNDFRGSTSCEVLWYDGATGSLLFSVTSSSPDAQGHFHITRTQALASAATYYAIVSVTDPAGVSVTDRAVATSTVEVTT